MFTADVRVQVPPRPPKRQSKDCLFFCQSILSKTVKTPDFLHESSQSGAFCISAAILIYLQLLQPIFPKRVGEMAAPDYGGEPMREFALRLVSAQMVTITFPQSEVAI